MMGRSELAAHGLDDVSGGLALPFSRAEVNISELSRSPLLEKKFGGLHERLAVKTLPRKSREDDVGESQQRHPLVVGHISANDGVRMIFPNA